MAKTLLPALLVLAAATIAGAPALAEEAGVALASPAYRLNIGEPNAFRLAAPYAPAPEPRREPAIPAQLAGKPFAPLIHSAARDTALDPALVHAVIFVESRYNPAARSPKGAVGLMQVLPATAARYGVSDPRSLEANLTAGTRYLSDLMWQFGSRLDLALAAYNAGENAVLRHGHRIPPYRETQLYVPAVLAQYREWREPPRPAPVSTRIEYLPGTRLDPQRR